jgi:hypothetical protein
MVVPRHDSSPETPEEPPSTTEYSTAVADDEHDHVGPAVVETDHVKTTNAVVAVAVSTTIVNDNVEQQQPEPEQQRLPTVDATEHDSAVMNRLLRPFQMGDMLQTIIGRSILVFVAFGFLLQLFGYSYIVEFNDDDLDRTHPATTTLSTEMRPRKSPPQLRIGTIEERQFLEEIRRDMKQQISN